MIHTGWPRSYRKYILQITQPSQYRYAKLQHRLAVTSGSPSSNTRDEMRNDAKFFFAMDIFARYLNILFILDLYLHFDKVWSSFRSEAPVQTCLSFTHSIDYLVSLSLCISVCRSFYLFVFFLIFHLVPSYGQFVLFLFAFYKNLLNPTDSWTIMAHLLDLHIYTLNPLLTGLAEKTSSLTKIII